MTVRFDGARRMLPRWRPSEDSLRAGELTVNNFESGLPIADSVASEMELLLRDYAANRSFGFAADVVSAASMIHEGRELPTEVRNAAHQVLAEKHASTVAKRLASTLLKEPVPTPESSQTPMDWSAGFEGKAVILAPLRRLVREQRKKVARYEFDALAWVDLARAHVCTGSYESAEHSMRVALGLAANNRFVLRSAVRLFIHLGASQASRTDLREEAWDRIRRSPAARRDPWLAATEVATAMVVDKSPRLVKVGRAMLNSQDHSPFSLSELAGALGSLEVESGSTRTGRKLFAQALIDPTENTIAQAWWTTNQRGIDLSRDGEIPLEASAEAKAWRDFHDEDWEAALRAAMDWQSDEPFSRRPFLMGTFLASGPLGDPDLAVRIGAWGLAANPSDTAIRNNVAFALASLGKPSSAMKVLDPVKIQELDLRDRIAPIATWGAICYRLGDPTRGRSFYDAAINTARHLKQRESECSATIYLAREEAVAGNSTEARKILERAETLVSQVGRPDLRIVFQRVEAIVRANSSSAPGVPKSANPSPK